MARTSKTMLNNSGESGHPFLIPDLRGNASSFSPLRMMFAVGLLYMAFIMLRWVPSIPSLYLAKALSSFLIFSEKNQLFVSLIFSVVFLVSNLLLL